MMLPLYLISTILSVSLTTPIPTFAAPISTQPRSETAVRFTNHFPPTISPSSRIKLSWDGPMPDEGWEVTVQPGLERVPRVDYFDPFDADEGDADGEDYEGYDPLMSVQYVVSGEEERDTWWETPDWGVWPEGTEFRVCVYGDPNSARDYYDCSPPMRLSLTSSHVYDHNHVHGYDHEQGRNRNHEHHAHHQLTQSMLENGHGRTPLGGVAPIVKASQGQGQGMAVVGGMQRVLRIGEADDDDDDLSVLLGLAQGGVSTGMLVFQ